MSEEIKIRKLLRKDRKTVSQMFLKLIEKVGDIGLLDLISSDVKESSTKKNASKKSVADKPVEIGMKVVQLCLTTLEEDAAVWFADLVNKTVEDFDEMPLDVEIQIIKQLREAEEVSDFFSGASQQFSEIKRLLDNFKKKNQK